jgi:hypothetical protein
MPGIEEGWDGERKAPWEPRSFTELGGVGSREGEVKGPVLTARAALVSYRKSGIS